jgi:hypothetical protein
MGWTQIHFTLPNLVGQTPTSVRHSVSFINRTHFTITNVYERMKTAAYKRTQCVLFVINTPHTGRLSSHFILLAVVSCYDHFSRLFSMYRVYIPFLQAVNEGEKGQYGRKLPHAVSDSTYVLYTGLSRFPLTTTVSGWREVSPAPHSCLRMYDSAGLEFRAYWQRFPWVLVCEALYEHKGFHTRDEKIRLTNSMHQSLKSLESLSWSANSSSFMEPEGSLPCSQEPATGAYPEPDESSAYPLTLFP